MNTPVHLSEIIGGIEMQSPEVYAYLNKATGEVFHLSQEELGAVERGQDITDFPEWQQEMVKLAQEVWADVARNKYLQLPTQFEVHEYQIMADFSLSLTDDRISDELYYTIKGSGAFRRFKEAVHRLGVVQDWYDYRDNTFKQMAIDWCERNGVTYTT